MCWPFKVYCNGVWAKTSTFEALDAKVGDCLYAINHASGYVELNGLTCGTVCADIGTQHCISLEPIMT